MQYFSPAASSAAISDNQHLRRPVYFRQRLAADGYFQAGAKAGRQKKGRRNK
jgi:hypothetical protein